MTQRLQPLNVRGLDRGMAADAVVADTMMPKRQMRHIENMDTDKIGVLKVRDGYTRLGSAAVVANNIGLGLHHHISSTAANTQIVAFIDDAGDSTAEAFFLSSGTWTNKALGFTKSIKVRTTTFLDLIMAVNGIDSPKSWTGATGDAWGTTSMVSAPTGHLINSYKQQVFIGNETTNLVSFSSVPTGGAITWTASDSFFVNPNDGSKLKAFQRYAGQQLIIKEDYIYRFNGRSIDPDPVIFNGASSQEAVVVAKGVMWFFDGRRNAILGYSGGFPREISKPVRPFLEAIPTSSFGDVALRGDHDHVEAFIGTVTVEGVTYTNCALRYVISTQTWVVRTYAGSFKVFADYDDGTDLFNLGFTSIGQVNKMDNGLTDDDTGISFIAESTWHTFGDNPANELTLAGFSAFGDPPVGTDVQLKTERDDTWRTIGKMHKYVNSWMGINAGFHKIKFRFTGVTSAARAELEGYSLMVPIFKEKEVSSKRIPE